MRFAGYGRMSTDKQNPLSAEDQIHDIRTAGEAKGWTFVEAYTDNAVSGFSTFGRDQFARMQEEAKAGKFNCIVVEDLDRLSRNLGDLAKFSELMNFYGVAIYSLSKGGFMSDLDIGFKGTMSAQFLQDLSQKTKRGLAAKFRSGKSAGGISYGYDKTIDPGVHKINSNEADVVRRIFTLYAEGYSPRMIAGQLNAEKIPGPRGGVWNASSINGHRQRGVGILRNQIYIGRRVWGETQRVKNPETGRKVLRLKSGEKLEHDVPELQIVDQELWDKVQSRLPNRVNAKYKKRTDHLLSGVMKCGECGSSYTSIGGGKYIKFGCSARRERSTCSNRRLISRSLIDNCMLYALKEHLLQSDCVEPAINAYNDDLKHHVAKLDATRPKLERRLIQISDARQKLFTLLERGVEPNAIEVRLLELDDEERANKRQLADAPQPITVDPAEAVERYRKVIDQLLTNTFENNYAYRQEVMTAVRELIDEVIIYPKDDLQGRDVELIGDIEALFLPPSDSDSHLGMETMVPGGGLNKSH